MVLSILICTVVDRRTLFEELYKEFDKQIKENSLEGKVEVLFKEDNKEISVGRKRQLLLDESKADYIVYFDSDDFPCPTYVIDIYDAIVKNNPDCVGFLIKMTTDGGNKQVCCHSLQYKVWDSGVDGYDYVRNVTHFNPVKRELALKVGFADKRFGEDKEYSDNLTALCETEVFIDKEIFHYRFSTAETSDKKYGFDKDKN